MKDYIKNFIDNNFKHLKIVENNAKILQVQHLITSISASVYNLPINEQQLDCLFVDPPYQLNYLNIINELEQKKWLSNNVLFIIEWGKKSNIKPDYFKQFLFLQILDIRGYGETFFGFFLKK